MYRRPGDLRKSKARKRQMRPYVDKWRKTDEHIKISHPDWCGTMAKKMDKNFRKKAPFAGWQSGADKELFHLDRLKKKEEHFMLDMSEWTRWDELVLEEESERIEREEYDFWMMEEEMQWMAQDYFDDQMDDRYRDDEDHYYDPYEPDDRWWQDWDYPDDMWREDKGCDCPECNPGFYDEPDPYAKYGKIRAKELQMEKMWADHKTAQQEEEALAVAESYELDPEELAEYYYQLQL